MKIERHGYSVTITRDVGEPVKCTAVGLLDMAMHYRRSYTVQVRLAEIELDQGNTYSARHALNNAKYYGDESEHWERLAKMYQRRDLRERRLAPEGSRTRGTAVTANGNKIRGIASVFYNP